MSVIKQYRPNFFTGFEEHENEFNSLNELFDIDWVNNFTQRNGHPNPNFHRFSIDFGEKQNWLIAEYDKGYTWWVVGEVSDKNAVKDLPIFEAKSKTEKT